jgi:hypothetical protein
VDALRLHSRPVRRARAAVKAVLAIIATLAPASAPAAEGGTDRSPTYGYTIHYDATWSVVQETSANGTDTLALTNDTSTVTLRFEGFRLPGRFADEAAMRAALAHAP